MLTMNIYICILCICLVFKSCSADETSNETKQEEKDVEAILTVHGQIYPPCAFQEQLDLSIVQLEDKSVTTYDLRKKYGSQGPLTTQAAVTQATLGRKNVTSYKDVNNHAQLQLSCKFFNATTQTYVMEGSVCVGDKWYTLIPTAGGRYHAISATNETKPKDDGGCHRPRNEVKSRSKRHWSSSGGDRQPQVYFDVVALIDYSVFKRWYDKSTYKDDIKGQDSLNLINRYMARVFKLVDVAMKSSVALDFHINLIAIIIKEDDNESWLREAKGEELGANSDRMEAKHLLRAVQKYAATARDIPNFDHLILFTSYKLYKKVGGKEMPLLGLTNKGTLCQDERTVAASVSIVHYEGRLMSDVLMTAHEFGHALGATHDGEDGSNCPVSDDYIMTPVYSNRGRVDHNRRIRYSFCSKSQMLNHFYNVRERSRYSDNCVMTKMQAKNVANLDKELRGQLFDVHMQCRMTRGENSHFCEGLVGPRELCMKLFCKDPRSEDRCIPGFAAEGTTCSSGMWCSGSGHCVASDRAPKLNEKCLFGNQMQGAIRGDQVCEDILTATTRQLCYQELFWDRCCGTCISLSSSDPDCPFGDNLEGGSCSPEVCDKTKMDYVQRCCFSCRHLRKKKPPIHTGKAVGKTECVADFDPVLCKDKNATTCCGFEAMCCRTCKLYPCPLLTGAIKPFVNISVLLFIYSAQLMF